MNPYPAELRERVVLAAQSGAVSTRELAREFGVSQSCVQRWLKVAANKGYPNKKRVSSSPQVDPTILLSRVRELEKNVAELRRALGHLEELLRRNGVSDGHVQNSPDVPSSIADSFDASRRVSYYK